MRQGVRDAKVEPTFGYKHPLKINRLRIYKTKKLPRTFRCRGSLYSWWLIPDCLKLRKKINKPTKNQ